MTSGALAFRLRLPSPSLGSQDMGATYSALPSYSGHLTPSQVLVMGIDGTPSIPYQTPHSLGRNVPSDGTPSIPYQTPHSLGRNVPSCNRTIRVTTNITAPRGTFFGCNKTLTKTLYIGLSSSLLCLPVTLVSLYIPQPNSRCCKLPIAAPDKLPSYPLPLESPLLVQHLQQD